MQQNNITAKQRNMLQFMPATMCQAPARSYASTCKGSGSECIDTMHEIGGASTAMHKDKCTVTTDEGTYDGVVRSLGSKVDVCYYSRDGTHYDGANYTDRFPAPESRPCCGTSDFLFTRSLWNASMAAYECFLLASKMMICINYIVCAAIAAKYWNDWMYTRKVVFWAWIFPFILKFVAFSIPVFDAGRVDKAYVADMTLQFGLQQIGFTSYKQLQSVARVMITDTIRTGIMTTGVWALTGSGDALKCGADAAQFEVYKDTFDGAKATLIEEHVIFFYPTMRVKLAESGTSGQSFSSVAEKLGYGRQSRCAAMYHLSKAVCLEAQLLGATEELGNLPNECQLCSDIKFCNTTSDASKSQGCCGSCLEKMPEVVEQGRGEPGGATAAASLLQTQSWKDGYSECVGPPTPDTKRCTAGQAVVPLDANMKRLFSCRPWETMRFLQSVNRRQSYAITHEVPALAVCGNLTGDAAARAAAADPHASANTPAECFKAYETFPLAVDMQLPYAMAQVNKVLDEIYQELKEQAESAVVVAVRLQAAAKSAIGLLPITIAILPGLAKGAIRVKQIVPQTSLIGFVLVIVPMLQLPMLGVLLAILIQAGGTWRIQASVYCFLLSQIAPAIPGARSTQPHKTAATFKLAHKDKDVSMLIAILIFLSLVLVAWEFGTSDLTQTINLDDIMGSVSQQFLVGVNVILSYMLGKTLTVVMSADLFLQLLIFLETYAMLAKEVTKTFRERMVAGFLLSTDPDHAKELIDKYDKDGEWQCAVYVRGLRARCTRTYCPRHECMQLKIAYSPIQTLFNAQCCGVVAFYLRRREV
jgi:hypothetical protein